MKKNKPQNHHLEASQLLLQKKQKCRKNSKTQKEQNMQKNSTNLKIALSRQCKYFVLVKTIFSQN